MKNKNMFFYIFIKHYKNIKLQMFPIATFCFRHFYCNRDYGTCSSMN